MTQPTDPFEPTPGPQLGGEPVAGYTVPPMLAQPTHDPLISPDYAGWWQRSIAIVRKGWRVLAGLQAFAFVIALVIQVPIAVSAVSTSEQLNRGLNDPNNPSLPDLSDFLALFGLSIGGVVIVFLVSALATLASVHVGVSVAIGSDPQLGPALRLAGKRILPLIGWQFLGSLITLLFACLCLLPALYPTAVFTILPVVVLLERGGVIPRCFALFNENLGSAVARTATIAGITVGVQLFGGVIGQIIESALSGNGHSGQVVGAVIAAALTQLGACAAAVLTSPLTLTTYADLRSRYEPLSTATLAQELGMLPPSSPTDAAYQF